MSEYHKKFLQLTSRAPTVPEDFLIGTFISGLRDEILHGVQAQNPLFKRRFVSHSSMRQIYRPKEVS